VNGLSGVTEIAAGMAYLGLAVARRTVHGIRTTLTSVYSWGSDESGQLGYSVPGTQPGSQPVPQVVPGLPQVTGIATGVGDALAIGADGSVWGWGRDQYGQLGNSPRTASELSPVETFAPGSGITQISTTNDFTLALRSDGTVLAFGANEKGQAGTGTTSPTSTPVQVSGLTGVSQISACYSYGLAVHRVLALSLPAG
jgi:alpha-tubulin suppressor-like RCC1 family protein